METYSRNEQDKDVWTYSTQSASYKVQTTYKLLMGHQPVQPVLKWLWKSYCQPKHRVFFWLLMKDRLSIKNILKRRKCNWIHSIVLSVHQPRKKQYFICSGDAHTHNTVGNYWLTDNRRWGHGAKHPATENSTAILVFHDSNHFDELDDLESEK